MRRSIIFGLLLLTSPSWSALSKTVSVKGKVKSVGAKEVTLTSKGKQFKLPKSAFKNPAELKPGKDVEAVFKSDLQSKGLDHIK